MTGVIAQLQAVSGTSDPATAHAHIDRATALARHNLGEATVKTHLTHIYGRSGAKDRAAAVTMGHERGILGRT
ncbi:two-component system sensor kinase (plasmid) [Streptomyces clavuligerus]|uniref:Two-component system sensor kinase n=1 Tax=Streptomyces clavuligerus TaxID=1901 RepID=B5GTQ4_STRCL|nr:hypothetical protein SSCG_02802 [Streptomyces clavuligerus]EFG04121.1 two-component system sensor kinase [Streptomyces clavuligerus]